MSEHRKTGFSKAVAAAIAAAAVMITATVSVGAASGWNFNSAFQSIFGKTAENQGESVSQAYFDFNKYGKALDMWYDCDNFRLNIKGICADQTSAYVLYDVVFDESCDYEKKDGWEDWYLSSIMEAYVPGEEQTLLGRINVMDHDLISQNGNVFSYYVMGRLSDAEDTFEGKIVTLDFGELARAIPAGSEKADEPYLDCEKLDCGVHAEIPVDFPICTENRSLELNEDIDCSEWDSSFAPGTRAVLTNLEITPFNWSFFVETDTSWMGKGDGYSFTFSVTLTDGRVVSPQEYSQKTTENGLLSRGQFIPFDYDKIESVTICGKTIPIS